MKKELDSLATALHVKTDDLPKDSPQFGPWRPAVGITLQLSDAELVTLAMMQAMLGFTSEARWLRHARAHLRHLFPYPPQQPGYNKRLRKAADSNWPNWTSGCCGQPARARPSGPDRSCSSHCGR